MPINNNQNKNMNKGRVSVTEPSPMVQQMAQQNYAMKNGGELPMQGAPGGASTPVAPQPMDMNFFGGNGGANGKFEAPAIGTSPDLTPDSKAPDPKYGTGGVQSTNPAQTQQNDLSSLSAALNSAGVSSPSSGREFTADEAKRDGGFFGWIKGIAPKLRPGRRDGETDDEYDLRNTQNMQRVATFADAIRHMGNIVNTYKGGPLQRFNDPTDYLMAGYEKRNAERTKREALAADQAYKAANLSLKERAAEAKNAYDQLILGYKDAADKRAAQAYADNKKYKDDYFTWQKGEAEKKHERLSEQDKQKQDNWQKQFDENVRHHKALEGISASKGSVRHGGSGGRSGGNTTSLTNVATPNGRMNRKKDLSAIEKKQITQFLIKNGYINKKNMDAYNTYSTMDNKQPLNDLVNYWIAHASNMTGGKGDAFRSHLKNHYMYVETNTVNPSTSNGKSVVTITHKGNKGKTTSKGNDTKNKFHVD